MTNKYNILFPCLLISRQNMTWNESRDLMMLRMIAAEGVFSHKFGSRERGKAWQLVADELNGYPNFTVSARSLRDRYSILSKKLKMKNAREQKESGGGGDQEPTETEVILEELAEIAECTEKQFEEESEKKKELNEQDKVKATEMRDRAMERFGQTRKRVGQDAEADDSKSEKVKRRSSSDTLEWLREKGVEDKKLKEEEAKQRKEELELLRMQQSDLSQQLLLQQQNQQDQTRLMQQQLAQQMQQQQQQQQQQFLMMQQQMLAVIQQLGMSHSQKD